MSRRHICVHGHFYQPPRENPWTGAVEREESARPFHDWNERISEECYSPLAARGTLERMAFDFGPTLLSWLERERPALLERVLQADRRQALPDGLGPGLAQPYFHVILPLESRRDKETHIRWGLAEFKARFGREAHGMWLPETAVDDDTLDALAAEGVRFTILDPIQAAETRGPGGGAWETVDPEKLDPKTPYLWRSKTGRTLALFFYHRRLSRGVVSGETTRTTAHLVERAKARLLPGDAAQLIHVASDGEFYGHHHPGADLTLDRALRQLEAEGVSPVTHARFLSLFAPPREARVKERTAWSCEHGLGRWESDCGCRSPHLPDWSQAWRGPFREALNRLAARLDVLYEDEAGRLLKDPWAARDASIALWLAPSEETRDRFLAEHGKRPLARDDRARALRLLAMQRERLAMFTSCGWFFDDVSGVEAVLCLRRAARAVDLGRLLGEDAEGALVERLAACKSNVPGLRDGGEVWRRMAAPDRVGLDRAAAHAAILDHLGLAAPEPPLLRWETGPAFRADKAGLAGRDRTFSIRPVAVRRAETMEEASFQAVVHRADRLDVACWLAPAEGALDAAALGEEFLRLNDDELRASLDAQLGVSRFGLDAVLTDERAELAKALSAEGASGAHRAAFMKRWTETMSALRRGGLDDEPALALLAECGAHGFLPEHLPWAGELEARLHARLEGLVRSPSDAAAASGALRWLDSLWDANLIAAFERLRDAQRRWSEALAHEAPSAARDACRALGERLSSPVTT